jgi:CheY-like chemotaxis protein
MSSVCRILVVDDHADGTDTMAALLQLLGHAVRTAYDGLTAIDIAKDFKPDVVLLDLGMPRLDGLAVARALRQLPEGYGFYLVAVTGWVRLEDREHTKEAGFDAHLAKPVDSSQLEAMLARYCRHSHGKRQAQGVA